MLPWIRCPQKCQWLHYGKLIKSQKILKIRIRRWTLSATEDEWGRRVCYSRWSRPAHSSCAVSAEISVTLIDGEVRENRDDDVSKITPNRVVHRRRGRRFATLVAIPDEKLASEEEIMRLREKGHDGVVIRRRDRIPRSGNVPMTGKVVGSGGLLPIAAESRFPCLEGECPMAVIDHNRDDESSFFFLFCFSSIVHFF